MLFSFFIEFVEGKNQELWEMQYTMQTHLRNL